MCIAINEGSLREIVETTMQYHPRGCIFKTNAIELIVRQTIREAGLGASKEQIIDACERAFRDAELVCPAHGKDPAVNRLPTI